MVAPLKNDGSALQDAELAPFNRLRYAICGCVVLGTTICGESYCIWRTV